MYIDLIENFLSAAMLGFVALVALTGFAISVIAGKQTAPVQALALVGRMPRSAFDRIPNRRLLRLHWRSFFRMGSLSCGCCSVYYRGIIAGTGQ